MDDKKTDIAKRLLGVQSRCGEWGPLVANIASAIKTGYDPQGAPSTEREEIQALVGLARMLENMGKARVAMEIADIVEAMVNYGWDYPRA